MGQVEGDKSVTYQLVTSLTGKMLFRCEATLLRGHQCFCLASGACDNCLKTLCSEHKCKRIAVGKARTVEYILCSSCAAQYDYDKNRKR